MTTPTESPTPNPTPDPQTRSRRGRGRRFGRRFWLLSGVPLAAMGLWAARAHGHGHGPFRHGSVTSAEQLQTRMNRRLEFMLDRVDATDAQRAAVQDIVAARAPELFELRRRGRALRDELLTAVRDGDRAQQELLRKRGVTLFDEATAAGMRTAQEVADELDPEQRAEVLSYLDRFMRHRHDAD